MSTMFLHRGSGEGGGKGGCRPCGKKYGGLAPLKLSVVVMESLAYSIIRDTLIEQSQYSLRSSVASYVCSYIK